MEKNEKPISKYLLVSSQMGTKAASASVYENINDIKNLSSGWRLFRIEICEEYEAKISPKAA